MGLGHVSPRAISPAGPSSHVPRRQRRGARASGAVDLTKHRLALGERGELVASWFLGDHGMRVVDRNVAVGSGELDILATDGATRVVVEVRTTQTPLDPIDAVDAGKRRRVHELARLVGADRVDFIGVGVNPGHVDIHWVPGRP